MSNARTIAKNTGWYGLENIISSVVTIFTSIAIARTLGPSKMGYIIYVMWIATVVSALGSLGIPAATSKYMAEFIGKGNRGTARFIFIRTLLLQTVLATAATLCLIALILHSAEPEYRWASLLIVLSVWPMMVNSISAAANGATEQLEMNVPASVISAVVFLIGILCTMGLNLGVLGVSASFLLMRIVDFAIRLIPTLQRILQWESTNTHPAELSRRMTYFALQSVISLLIALVVWNRSEIFLLKVLCSDIRQVAFYSVAFSLADRLLIGSSVFGLSASTTMFAQYGRDESRLANLAASSFRYLALTAIPLHSIATALAAPALLVLYGNKYEGAAVAVTLAPLLCMPKAFLAPVLTLLQSTERQGMVIAATVMAGVLDIGAAWYLIPRYGAVGACFANGAGQVMAIGGMWTAGIWLYRVKLPWRMLSKISVMSIAAAVAAYYISIHFSPLWGIVWGGAGSLVVLFLLLVMMRVLEPQDHARFTVLIGMLPKRVAPLLDRFLSVLSRPKLANATSTNA